jgi:DNA-binding XRE family transcriptional regulator
MLSISHIAYDPQLVDHVNTTTGGLPTFSEPRDIARMAEPLPYAEIGARLRRVREANSDDSQKQWAERHGFSPTQYNNWEKGARRIPVDSAERLCDLYGLTLDFVYRGRLDGLSENARKAV